MCNTVVSIKDLITATIKNTDENYDFANIFLYFTLCDRLSAVNRRLSAFTIQIKISFHQSVLLFKLFKKYAL